MLNYWCVLNLNFLICGFDFVTQSHPFLLEDAERDVDMRGWVAQALQWRDAQRQGRLRKQEPEQQHPVETMRPPS